MFDRVRERLGIEPAEVRVVRWAGNEVCEADGG